VPSAAILAGGRARRFGGVNKGALLIEGRSIFERQIDELSRIADDLLLVGGTPPTAVTAGVRAVPDRIAGCGPLGGLDAALAAARAPSVVVIACDMPFVTSALLGHLLTLTSEADAVVPKTERGYHPLCAAYTRQCLAAVSRRLAERRLEMTGLLEDLRVRTVTADEIRAFGASERLLANVNSPGDLEHLAGLIGHEP
jgi:molybdopterin-guanine dinucleotide biosynthesis protein A